MQSNSELANSWNIKQNSGEENFETDIENNCIDSMLEETFNSNKSLTKYNYIFTNTLVFYLFAFYHNYYDI